MITITIQLKERDDETLISSFDASSDAATPIEAGITFRIHEHYSSMLGRGNGVKMEATGNGKSFLREVARKAFEGGSRE